MFAEGRSFDKGDEPMKLLARRIHACLIVLLVAAVLGDPGGPLRAQDNRVPELRPLSSDPITVRMEGQTPRNLYETIARFAGINVLLNGKAKPESETARFTVELSKATLREALDKVASVTKTSWKPISENTILVALR
jgi:hypothetical protein